MAYSTSTEYTETYTSYSGCDIVCTFGSQVIGSLQGISYSVTREKAPLYTMGNANMRSMSRGKRGIAGTLVFAVFDRSALMAGLEEHIKANKTFRRVGGEINNQPYTIEQWDTMMEDVVNGSISGVSVSADAENRTAAMSIASTPTYADEIPPFDITISMANEYGHAAVMVIYGVEILNLGSGFSIDNIMSQEACTFAARAIKPLQAVEISS